MKTEAVDRAAPLRPDTALVESPGMAVVADKTQLGLELKDAYQVLLSTRNLEIGLFWQRSNYFLVLNSGLALGFFSLLKANSGGSTAGANNNNVDQFALVL